jgi:YesN/AraC family two-component response regulator
MTSLHVLFVDDEQAILDGLRNSLRKERKRWEMTFALGGQQALEEMKKTPADVVITDMRMPGMDGIALLEAAKERFPDMPVVMVTAVTDVSVALGAIRNGAYDYLLKPFEREQLLATVRRALENRRLKLENRAYQTNLEALVTARTEQLRKAIKELEESYDITLEALGDALDLKDRENAAMLPLLPTVCAQIDALEGEPQFRAVIEGVFAGNIFDMGAEATAKAFLGRSPDFFNTPLCKCTSQYQPVA